MWSEYNPKTEENFWLTLVESSIERENNLGACWNRVSNIQSDGYSKVKWRGKEYKSHRLAYYFTYGEWITYLCHYCNNTTCSRPTHLYPGNDKDNALDRRDSNKVKLDMSIAKQIRYLWFVERIRPQSAIAVRFNISQALVSFIVANKEWIEDV